MIKKRKLLQKPGVNFNDVKTKPTMLAIVTVVRNARDAIGETLENVVKIREVCNFPVEHIVIDGGSTDGTTALLSQYSSKLFYWHTGPDNGIYDAMNHGWNVAPHESAILFLGAGDMLISPPTELKSHVVYGTVKCGSREFCSRTDWMLRIGNTVHHQALLVPRQLFDTSPFDLRFPTYADFDVNQKLLKNDVFFEFDPNFFSYALPGGVSSELKVAEMSRIVRRNYGPVFFLISQLYLSYQKIKAKQ